MERCRVGITEFFDAAHCLPGHPKCGSLHGHTYRVDVVVEAPLVSDMLIDFAQLKQTLWQVLENYDHKFLNEVIPQATTVENIARHIHQQLKAALALTDATLTVRVYEGDRKWAEWEG